MIIQTGMRTDIPAFYSEWLQNRLEAGFVLVRNPFNPHQVTSYSLSPDVVDALAFCTKNPAPMLPILKECHEQLGGNNQSDNVTHRFSKSQARLLVASSYWFVTITPYGRDVEPNVPDAGKVIEDFKALSDLVGIDSVGWRYDPIFIDDKHSIEWHLAGFHRIASELSGYTKTCVISFIDIYKKLEKNFPNVKEVTKAERLMLGREMIKTASKYGMTVRPCAEGRDLEPYGADCSGCMTVKTFETALGAYLNVPKNKSNQRNGQCACLLGTDIGAYNTCGHLCKYCYANANAALVRDNMKQHDPTSPFLIGGSRPGDVIHQAKQESWIDRQLRLDLT